MTFNSASNWWQSTVTVPDTATNLNCCFNNGSGNWDNNGGANWNFTVMTNGTSQVLSAPLNLAAIPVATNVIELTWSASAGAGGYQVSRDDTTIATTTSTNYTDTGLAADSSHCYFIIASNSVGLSTASATVCTNTLIVPFALDGAFDYPDYLLASNGMVLYAAVRGTTLYVATWSPGDSGPNDNFIFVSDQLLSSASAPAPWAKAGDVAVAATKPYLAGESQNSYVSWYANNAETNWPCAKSAATTGAMEGTLDLVGAFGYLPTNIYLCAASYVTTNGGALVAQYPAGSGGTNLAPTNFLEIPVAALNDSPGNGIFNLCDPARGFTILSASLLTNGCLLNWAAMPLRGYQVQFSIPPGGPWADLPGASNDAGSLQMQLSYTDAPPMTASQRFYRIELLPLP
jgi:hypothetical protein